MTCLVTVGETEMVTVEVILVGFLEETLIGLAN
jgi:hypothetical protein